jgi:uncharacterized protein YdeI (YjbR/CyaY-like superfamily)
MPEFIVIWRTGLEAIDANDAARKAYELLRCQEEATIFDVAAAEDEQTLSKLIEAYTTTIDVME